MLKGEEDWEMRRKQREPRWRREVEVEVEGPKGGRDCEAEGIDKGCGVGPIVEVKRLEAEEAEG